jgi:HAD superfamily hydrolase (TIGR01509 family)
MPAVAALLFDLDGTLVDTAYQHTMAWRDALASLGMDLAVWRIHRRIGMSGDQLVTALAQDLGRVLSDEETAELEQRHGAAYARLSEQVHPLPGARELLTSLTARGLPWTIATSSRRDDARPALEALDVPEGIPVVTREGVAQAKPAPDLFLAAAERLGVPMAQVLVVGDSTWDLLAARRGGARGIGLLCGGYGADELRAVDAFRVFADPADLLRQLDEIVELPAA